MKLVSSWHSSGIGSGVNRLSCKLLVSRVELEHKDSLRPDLPSYSVAQQTAYLRPMSYRLIAALAPLLFAPVATRSILAQEYPPDRGPHRVAVDSTILVAMPDGVRLSMDLYKPVGAPEPLPTILWRTPYDKNRMRRAGSEPYALATYGYVVAVQDTRGKFESEGIFDVQVDDADDGDATVDWLASQPWSSGRVAMLGCSYSGEAQVLTAPKKNPNLVALVPRAAGGPARYLSVWNGGAFELALAFGWMRNFGNKVNVQPAAGIPDSLYRRAAPYLKLAPEIPETDYPALWRSLPLVGMVRRSGAPPSDWDDLVSHPPGDPWWNRFPLVTDTTAYDVPALHVNSWYDYGIAETFKQFRVFRHNGVSPRARENQYVIVSPTTHCFSERATKNTVVGERPVGDARLDYWRLYLQWFDRWLNGNEAALEGWPTVRYYLMGENEWRSADDWPIPGTEYQEWYLHSGGAANSRFGDGSLSRSEPGDEPRDSYRYDPETPVPSVGGPLCCTDSPDASAGAYDQSEVEMRHDILVYTSPELRQGLTVVGPLELVLYVSSDARDTDFTAKLVDVYPDGTAYNVQEGILRARYQKGFHRRVWMEEGEAYELRINLHATANRFGLGHRIRLEVSSSNFPRFDRNLNTGGSQYDETSWLVATNAVHHTALHPSRLILPVVSR